LEAAACRQLEAAVQRASLVAQSQAPPSTSVGGLAAAEQQGQQAATGCQPAAVPPVAVPLWQLAGWRLKQDAGWAWLALLVVAAVAACLAAEVHPAAALLLTLQQAD